MPGATPEIDKGAVYFAFAVTLWSGQQLSRGLLFLVFGKTKEILVAKGIIKSWKYSVAKSKASKQAHKMSMRGQILRSSARVKWDDLSSAERFLQGLAAPGISLNPGRGPSLRGFMPAANWWFEGGQGTAAVVARRVFGSAAVGTFSLIFLLRYLFAAGPDNFFFGGPCWCL